MSAGYGYKRVGSGAAGSVLASRLSETGNARILLLEQGRRDKFWLLRLPTGFTKMIGGHRDLHIQESVPQSQIGGRVQTILHGEVLGGLTSVNAMVYMRGRAADYDNWAELTSVAFGESELKHLYIITARWGLDEPGQSGHLFVVDTDVAGLHCLPFAAPWQN